MNNLPKMSPAYRSKLTSAIVSISIFFTVYLILIAISLFLIVLLGYGAYSILAFKVSYYTLIAAAGLASIGIFVFYFMIKFIFKRSTSTTRHLVEITRSQQPELFSIIDEIVTDTQVKAPKKVFLSPDVNASVSYNSVFWSMFFPVRKNLTIGLGLINSTSIGELKTILAHEFGHFSQRSMKVGGYVHHAQKIVYETVYNNKEYEDMILNFSGNSFLTLFGAISVGFINIFQFILKKVSSFLFQKHASLSREMEYHADAVSTFLTNPEEQISSLLRIALSDSAFYYSFNFYTQSEQKYLPQNLYKNHASLLKIFSERNNHPYVNGLPKVDEGDLTRYNKTKIEIQDQWASHPDTAKRIERIRNNQTRNIPENHELAKNIIRGYDEICEVMTRKYLTLHQVKNVGEVIDDEKFIELYIEKYPYQYLSSNFNGYYEAHNPLLENIETIIAGSDTVIDDEDLFSDTKVSLIYEKAGIESDLQTLAYLKANPKEIKTFRYGENLYKAKDATKLIPELESELLKVKTELMKNDEDIFRYYFSKADQYNQSILLGKYKKFGVIDKEFDRFQEALTEFVGYLQFMTVTLPFEEIRKHRAKLLKAEATFKKNLNDFIENSSYKESLTEESRSILKSYADASYIYFNHDKYLENEVGSVFAVVNEFQKTLNEYYLELKKDLLGFQADLDKAS
ncbi:Zn-dependent protease with chaperone function [Chryseobacterium carnipullorum]|uniref:M48 family metalloprotease n=1 Tax=Chryseobacterium carnipullorum TaxID=1124835 RepID=UPI00091C9618|nr:M48 family metallopeptidase [Chryseobacterium carnipullorum]SHL77959.1 Zn-dependent protease with chaperone function [Chryseobacterium carnipullorum]